jgi:hypothetical protein
MELRAKQAMMIAPAGHYRATELADRFLVYVVQTDDGGQITLSPEEFGKRYGWRNDPDKVAMPGNGQPP